MKVPDVFDQLPNGGAVRGVARIKEGADGFIGMPIGVFVVQGNDAHWVPAVDANRVALIGVLAGLLAPGRG